MASIKHTFRLQGPWKCRFYPLGNPASLNFAAEVNYNEVNFHGDEFKVTMPKSWQEIVGRIPGRLRLTRTFNLPPNLEAGDQLNLQLEEVNTHVKAFCADERIERLDEALPILTFKLPTNLPVSPLVEIELTTNEKTDWSQPIGLWKVVKLVISET